MLDTVDLSKSLNKEEYLKNLIRHQLQLRELAYQLYEHKRTLVVVYEGWDAAGKGGNLRRLVCSCPGRGSDSNGATSGCQSSRRRHSAGTHPSGG